VGSTGDVRLDAVGDRFGIYDVFNVVDGDRVRVGLVEHLGTGTTTNSIAVDIDIPAIAWSDGISGRATGPQVGQESHPPTPVPAVGQGAPNSDTGVRTSSAVIIGVLVAALVVVAIVIAVQREYNRRRKVRPADFRKVREVPFALCHAVHI
jgi:hypothetical protein